MESLLARALESKLKYWLRSFVREQFKLQGRTVQLCNLDLNGEVLHASVGLPPTLLVQQARICRLEIKLPFFSNVQLEPIVVEIDKLDLILVEKSSSQHDTPCAIHTTSLSGRSSSYGFADKIADGMTLKIGIVNLMLETRGGAGGGEGAAWTPPLASITIRNLFLYTTNQYWQIVNLKEARDFSTNKKCIYVFKKLQWESISVDLLPHPNMFTDEQLSSSKFVTLGRDDHGARRIFFGGERFLDNISGEAHITIQRTEQNNPLGLEVQVYLPEVVCPALSEPGLRALLRFMTGVYVCMNRGDVDSTAPQSSEAAGQTIVAVIVEHIFLCIKDSDFQLELLLQCLNYMRVSILSGPSTKTMTRLCAGGLFLRDTFSFPPCTLVQPRMQNINNQPFPVPTFASEKLWPRIHPLGTHHLPQVESVPLLCIYSLQLIPSPAPPSLASQSVMQCHPLKINLQEESCLRIASFLAEVVVEHGVVIPDTSLDSMYFSLKEIDITIPVNKRDSFWNDNHSRFTGARLHLEGLIFAQTPSLTYRILKLEDDAACFALWHGQPVDASQRRWVMRASSVIIALETANCDDLAQAQDALDWSSGIWRCVEIFDPCIETAMVTADGSPLVVVPPPSGIVRFGISCNQYTSATSVEQLFFVLKMYEYMGKVSDAVLNVSNTLKEPSEGESMVHIKDIKQGECTSGIIEMVPSDTAVFLFVDALEMKFLESDTGQIMLQGPALVRICGSGFRLTVIQRTLGSAIAISTRIFWKDVILDCVETEDKSEITCKSNAIGSVPQVQASSAMRTVLWIDEGNGSLLSKESGPKVFSDERKHFLDIRVENVLPFKSYGHEVHSLSVTATIHGIRLGGGMAYNELLLHRFGILGADGGPGEGVNRVLKNISNGPFSSFLKPPQQVRSSEMPDEIVPRTTDIHAWTLTGPDDIEIDIQLQDWAFALEGANARPALSNSLPRASSTQRENIFWQSTFQCFRVTAQGHDRMPIGEPKDLPAGKHSLQIITVAIDGLQVVKPGSFAEKTQPQLTEFGVSNGEGVSSKLMDSCRDFSFCPIHDTYNRSGNLKGNYRGLNIEIRLVVEDDEADADMGIGPWVVESFKAAVKDPVEIEATRKEVDSLIILFKSEIESASRIIAGIMQLLKLQGSVGQAIDQLSSIGSGSLDRLMVPERSRRRSSIGSVAGSPCLNVISHQKLNIETAIARLGQAVCKSQELCAKVNLRLNNADDFMDKTGALLESTAVMKELEEMQTLLQNLKTEL